MLKKKDKFLDKIVKKDYNNELETVLEKKSYKENTKSNLLNILYKLEISYKDYACVKREVETKEEMIGKVILEIENNCDEIKLVKPNDAKMLVLDNKSFLVEKKNKRIICYPIERKILYCISKISKKDKIIKDKYFIINETLSDLINIGNCINTVEPLRDFNGYSWTTISKEIESVEHNIIYQNLLFLVGTQFLNKWVENKEVIMDYMEIFTNKMEENYGKELSSKFIKLLEDYSILIAVKFDKRTKEKLLKKKSEIKEELIEIEDNKEFVEKITLKKRVLTTEIRKIDETINNKSLLQGEYEKRNECLPLNEKIFSIRILSQIMEKERKEKLEELEELNELMKPQKFVQYKKELESKEEVLKILDAKDIQKEIDDKKLELQKIFLKCFGIKIKKAENKQELLDLIYKLRYFNMLPYDYEKSVGQVEKLKEMLIKNEKELIKRAHEMKLIEKLSKEEEEDYELLKDIFRIRAITLEEINIKLAKEKDKLYIQVFDGENMEENQLIEEKDKFKAKDLYIRFNKKIKIFI